MDRGILYLVATPIGNLADFTYRARSTLEMVDIICCENTETSRVLLMNYGISTKTISMNSHNESRVSEQMLEMLGQGKNIAVISDAGTPVLSDPGAILVSMARANGYRVVVIPGASALIAAVCGLGIGKFIFHGFLTNKDGKRRNFLDSLACGETHIFYESSHRVRDFVEDIVELFGERQEIGVAREISKIYEEFFWIESLSYLEKLKTSPPRGEFVLAVVPKLIKNSDEEELRSLLSSFKSGSTRDIVDVLKDRFDLPKRLIYDLVENFRKGDA